MIKPQPTTQGAKFSLADIAEELRASDAYAREGTTARTLTRDGEMRTVLVVVAAGKTVTSHTSRVSTAVLSLQGSLHVQLPDRVEELTESELLVLSPGVEYELRALDDAVFLLTLGWTARPPVQETAGS